MFTLEIAAHSLQSCLAARDGGADRIELCTALQTGGLTPSVGLIESVKVEVALPVHVLIRPRLGDFTYDKYEVREMVSSIKQCSALGVEGVVIGCLNTNGHIDVQAVKALVDAAEEMSLTFHRAFDLMAQPLKTLELIADLGFDRILTSGQAKSALEGKSLLRQLVEHAQGAVQILAGAGVNSTNVKELMQFTGCVECHGSAKKTLQREPMHDPFHITTQTGPQGTVVWESDVEEIRAIKSVLNQMEMNGEHSP